MPRVVSFIVLVAIILLTGALFFRVMAQFLVPLFLAVLLVVMFRPLHEWFLAKCKDRKRLAAGLTTLAILLVVLLPMTWILFRAVSEGMVLASVFKDNPPDWQNAVKAIVSSVRFQLEALKIPLPENEALLRMAESNAKELLASMAVGGVQAAAQFAGRLLVVFLLMVLTMLLALVPFVGAAAVWVPCCVWLYWHQQHVSAIVLAVYCGLLVSTVDNVIKPMVLHGQSGIHPLMALLSILGGVTALGPIGILVGPMLVAFLQALLNMLRAEMMTMDKKGTLP